MSKRAAGEDDDVSPEEMERRHFQHVVDSFLAYKSLSQLQVARKVKSLNSLPQHHQKMIPTQFTRLKEMSNAIEGNQTFIKKIIQFTDGMFLNSEVTGSKKESRAISAGDLDRVRTTLKQCVRDWSDEGKEERDNTYHLILDQLNDLYPLDETNRHDISVLVPGAGLARLMFEIARLGFTCQGNEFSLYMLFASNYILNMCESEYCESIYPWIHQSCNVVSNGDQLREIKIPDVNPQVLSTNCSFSMSAGDFLEVYTEPNSWDCITMCFFLDTAHNVIEYIERAHSILKPGGYLISLGPLLYHFAEIEKEPSVELTYEELKNVMLNDFKFKLIKEKMNVNSSYIKNLKSMFTMSYNCAFFVMQKSKETEEN